MVLVAAIAAGVLIDTAGMLQSQAEATGEESTDLVSERINTHSSVGVVDDAENGTISHVLIGVSSAPGATEIDLNRTIISVNGPGGQDIINYASAGSDAIASNDKDDIEAGEYVARDGDELLEPTDAVLNRENGQYQLVFNASAEPFADNGGFGEGDEATVEIISPSSAVTTVQLSAPNLFHEDGEGVRL